ncbi:MAG: isocitrate lyase/PEP mutase family protein [Rhodospirillales bacterium]
MAQQARPTWRELLAQEKPLVLPGAHDALSARLIEQAGFKAYVVGGFPLVGARYGIPDIGLVGLGEMAAGMRDILGASDLPALIDGDHGYGDAKNVARTVKTYEAMGAGALFLEDQVAPKRCGHMAGKDVVPCEVMEAKIRAAVAARQDPEFFLIARTDARAIHGLDDALRRGERYISAGADGLFIEAPESVEELAQVARSFDVPQFCNMLVSGRTPILSNRELHEMGFAMVVHGISLVMRVARVMQQSLAAIRDDAIVYGPDDFVSIEEFKTITGYDDWVAFEEAAKPKG